jgi:hypothetical protein
MSDSIGDLPLLRPGSHLGPDDGGCFMEYASLLAGERWSDAPRCTHPVLATLARLVNDAMQPAGRTRLARLVPDVIGRTGDPVRTSAAVVAAAVGAAQSYGVRSRSLDRHGRRARQRLDRVRRRQWSDPRRPTARFADLVYRRGPALHALEAVVVATGQLPADRRDAALRAALLAGMQACPRRPVAPLDRIPARPGMTIG